MTILTMSLRGARRRSSLNAKKARQIVGRTLPAFSQAKADVQKKSGAQTLPENPLTPFS